jgi:hypothetical protein
VVLLFISHHIHCYAYTLYVKYTHAYIRLSFICPWGRWHRGGKKVRIQMLKVAVFKWNYEYAQFTYLHYLCLYFSTFLQWAWLTGILNEEIVGVGGLLLWCPETLLSLMTTGP